MCHANGRNPNDRRSALPFVQRRPVVDRVNVSRTRSGVAARWLSNCGRAVGSRHLASYAFTAGVHLWDLTVGRLFPIEWSRLYLGVWTKRA